MLYLIGGASRAGKSILAGQLCTNHGIPWFSLDVLRMALFRGEPRLGLDPNRDDQVEAAHLWPIIREMIERLIDDGRDSAIEGVCLRPEDVASTIAKFKRQVTGCFLGYADASSSDKVDQILRHPGPNNWIKEMPASYVTDHVSQNMQVSSILRTQCQEFGLAYFDTHRDFDQVILSAVDFLLTAG